MVKYIDLLDSALLVGLNTHIDKDNEERMFCNIEIKIHIL
jgi:hypothetical protein